jgi:hypothetical protein
MAWNPETYKYISQFPSFYCLNFDEAERHLERLRKEKPGVRFEIFINVKDVEGEEKRLALKSKMDSLIAKLRKKR